MGSLRVYVSGDSSTALRYDAHRNSKGIVTVTFPATTAEHKVLEYTLGTAAIYPAIPGIAANDKRFDVFRRDFLDIFQLQAELHVLANHAASDPCALVLYKYSDMARYAPELVKGLTALDLICETLDRYLGGFVSYGMSGYKEFEIAADNIANSSERYPYPTLDTYPSLLISAYDYADGSGDERWLRQNYEGLRKWTDLMSAPNADGSTLLEYPISGNSGSWRADADRAPVQLVGYDRLRTPGCLLQRIGLSRTAQYGRARRSRW
jgi:hypothetical protein